MRQPEPEARPPGGGRAPLILAHRGACRRATENTLAAFRLAFELGADGVELDVRLSRDGEAVVHHDADLRRTAGRPERIVEVSSRDLARLPLRGPARLAGEVGIPTLAAVLRALPAAAFLDIEVKEEPWDDDRLERRVLRAASVRRGPTIFSSAAPRVLERLRALSEEARLALVVWDRRSPEPAALAQRLGAEALVVRRDLVTPRLVEGCRASALGLIPYNIDSPGSARRAAGLGAAAVITNRPEVVRRTLRPVVG